MGKAPTIDPTNHDEPAADALAGGVNDQDAPGLTWLNRRMRRFAHAGALGAIVSPRAIASLGLREYGSRNNGGRTKLEDLSARDGAARVIRN